MLSRPHFHGFHEEKKPAEKPKNCTLMPFCAIFRNASQTIFCTKEMKCAWRFSILSKNAVSFKLSFCKLSDCFSQQYGTTSFILSTYHCISYPPRSFGEESGLSDMFPPAGRCHRPSLAAESYPDGQYLIDIGQIVGTSVFTLHMPRLMTTVLHSQMECLGAITLIDVI